jgi:hypothetical protein
MHVQFDSVDLSQIPASAGAVAGYTGGRWPTDSHDALREKFPHAYVLSIAVNAGEDASCLDVESGDATPADVPGWVKRQLSLGKVRPCVYASLSVMPAIAASLHGVHRQTYRLWVADYDSLARAEELLKQGFGACQWTSNALGRDLDQSLCKPGFYTPAEYPLALEQERKARVASAPSRINVEATGGEHVNVAA